jgi:membrane-anchored glycerophosphoryl diester phosphodiesterase (GDPDase)
LSLLGFTIEKLCVGLLVCFATIAIGVNQFGMTWEVVAIAAIIGVILGAIAVNMIKPATIIVTAAAGALVIADAIFALTNSISHDYYTLILIGVAAIGAIFQFSNTKHID